MANHARIVEALIAALALLGLVALLSGCGAGAAQRTPSVVVVVRAPAAPQPPRAIELRLELPFVGLSSAARVSYAVSARVALLRGSVLPASTPVYLLDDEGNRTVVNPAQSGAFTVRAKLKPGLNSFWFTAARLGARGRTATLEVTWHGAAADRMSRLMAADPAKFLPPASAGLNRAVASLGNLRLVASGVTATTFKIDPIQAPSPPPAGGPGRWLGGFELTEYYPALEAWFTGARVPTPGLPTRHRIDWLYSAHGLSMEGEGVGLDGRAYHIDGLGAGGWISAAGGPATFGGGPDAPFWRTGGFWRTATGAVTWPLDGGGWSNGGGSSYVPPPAGISFAPGPSRALGYLRSVAVDPRVIPLGSHIFIPAYQSVNGGWFEADDTGGAIIGRHIDVFRPPPASPSDTGNFATGQDVYVVPPGAPLP